MFLWELLLAVPLVAVGGRWSVSSEGVGRRVLGLLTTFTVAHSLTLVAASLGVVPVPSSVVEVWVALSVLLGAVHLLRPLWPGRETLFAGTAGLVHGAAFAEGLMGSDLSARELALPLVSFNLGIEAAQGVMALGAFPLWRMAARSPWVRRGMALVGAGAGLGWLGELLFGAPHPAAAVFEVLLAAPNAVLSVAVLVAGLAWLTLLPRPLAPAGATLTTKE